jgi:hypothetical protein
MPSIGGIVAPTGGQATGRRTFLEIIDELARPIDASDSTTRALAADAFRSAVRMMNTKGDWPWERAEEDIAITANNSFSTVTSSIKKPLAMHYLNSVGGVRNRKLWFTPYDKFLEKYSVNVTGRPHIYTIPNLFETGQIRWWPIPNADDNARLTYYRVTPPPRVESEAVEIPDDAIETYMAFAWTEFLKRLPSESRPFPMSVALAQQRLAFRELSAQVNKPGDRSRWGIVEGYGYG